MLSPESDRLYARVGRLGIAPEKLLLALLLQAFYCRPSGCWPPWWHSRGCGALMSDEHFSVDGTLIQAWATHKSFQPSQAAMATGYRLISRRQVPRHPGYAVSQRIRKRTEEVFGWVKSSAGFRQTRHRGRERVGWCFNLTATANNLIRLPKLLAAAT